jgi:hypothetical protein
MLYIYSKIFEVGTITGLHKKIDALCQLERSIDFYQNNIVKICQNQQRVIGQ